MSDKQQQLLTLIRTFSAEAQLDPLEVIAACGMAIGESFAALPDEERPHLLADFVAMVLAQQGYPTVLSSQ